MTYRTFALLAILAACFLALAVFFPPKYETITRMRMTNMAIEQYRARHLK